MEQPYRQDCQKRIQKNVFLRQLKRAKHPSVKLYVFSTFVSDLFSNTHHLSSIIRNPQLSITVITLNRGLRCAMRIIFPTKSYAEALLHSRLLTHQERRQRMYDKLFKEIVEDPNHKLHPLLPELNTDTTYSLKTSRTFKHLKYKTDIFRNTVIIAARLPTILRIL